MSDPVRLTSRHLPAVIALHREVTRDLPPALVARESDTFFADHLERLGCIHGVFEGDRLVAYAVLGLPTEGAPNFGTDHGLTAEDLARVAHVDGIAVAPDRRGRHLHRILIRHRMEEARRAGRPIVLSTVAPGNLPSLANLLACGLSIRGMVEKFGGTRYLLRRDIDQPLPWPRADGAWLPLGDLEGQWAQFAAGAHGWRLEGRGAAERLYLAAPQEIAAPEPACRASATATVTAGDESAGTAAALRHAEAQAIIERHAAWAGAGGVLPLPLLDTAAVVAANLSMVKQLATLYGIPFRRDRTRTVVLSVIGGLLPDGAGALTAAVAGRLVPGAGLLGLAASSAAAIALTRLLGEAYRTHFETGAPLSLDPAGLLGPRGTPAAAAAPA